MNKNKQVYFIGIGGIGMSALARYYKATEWSVIGSDLEDSKLLKELRKEGIKVKIGHKRTNIPRKVDLVVYNQAISNNNIELKEALKREINLLSYPEAIGEITRKYKTIAIAGSHGKSTTTALISLILINAGFDPTVIIGTRFSFFNNPSNLSTHSNKKDSKNIYRSNFRIGKKEWLVLESDEYGRAFHNYSAYAAIITNIDKEHLDTYKNLSGVKKSFLKFIENIQDGGILVLNRLDKNLLSLENDIKRIVRTKKISVHWYDKNIHISSLVSLGLSPALIGEHNISNATGAHTLSKALGVPDQIAYNILKNFTGTWRRLEFRGYCQLSDVNCKLLIYDDYAHHPTEIQASLLALKSLNKPNDATLQQSNIQTTQNSPLICVFQPHQNERTSLLFNKFVDAFKDAEILILLPIYQVPGRDNKTQSDIKKATSENLAKVIQRKYPEKKVVYLKNPFNLQKVLIKMNSSNSIHNSILVMMGAGNIVRYTDYLMK